MKFVWKARKKRRRNKPSAAAAAAVVDKAVAAAAAAAAAVVDKAVVAVAEAEAAAADAAAEAVPGTRLKDAFALVVLEGLGLKVSGLREVLGLDEDHCVRSILTSAELAKFDEDLAEFNAA